MILNAAFLVNRRDAREFDRCVKALGTDDLEVDVVVDLGDERE